ncbi:MAG: hypothetical protein ACO23R_19480 [bacterium]
MYHRPRTNPMLVNGEWRFNPEQPSAVSGTPAPEQETMVISKAYVGNGEWRLANGERSWTCGQGSTIPATPSGVPSSRMEIQGQWTLMDLSR